MKWKTIISCEYPVKCALQCQKGIRQSPFKASIVEYQERSVNIRVALNITSAVAAVELAQPAPNRLGTPECMDSNH